MDDQTYREIQHLRELLEARMDSVDAALRLQAIEYERRLELLNHAHEEARRVASEVVTREKFDSYKTFQEEREATGRRMQWAALFTALLAVVGWVAQWGFR